jgi:hypothetical protein
MNKLWKTAEMRRFKGFSCTLTSWLVDELKGVIVQEWSFQPVNFSSFPGVFLYCCLREVSIKSVTKK